MQGHIETHSQQRGSLASDLSAAAEDLSSGSTGTPVVAVPQPIRGWSKQWTTRVEGRTGLPLVERVLLGRGIRGDTSVSFLQPSLLHLHDPALLPGLELAAERIVRAIRMGDAIVIYGDYDVDGISASAILFHAIRAVDAQANVQTYVPHRMDEGYGLNPQSVGELCANGAKLIVSVDCGITAILPAQVARDAGVDLIITDHHNLGSQLPDAYAMVHPRLPGSTYPFGDLCGAGVAFKLAWRVLTLAHGSSRLPERARTLLLDLLGLASLGVIADIVPLVGENRVMARFGLARLKSSPLEGLRALLAAAGLDGEHIAAEDVGFKLGPRLNACGRMGHAREAVELLTTATGARAREIAEHLTKHNELRRATEKAIFEHACELAEQHGMTGPDMRAIVLAHSEWHQGVVGIVCSRLVEKYCRPTLLLCEHHGSCHGSGRSVEGVSLYAALDACRHHLTQFGGHDMAAGLKLETAQLHAFTQAFVTQINSVLPVEALVPRAQCDGGAMIEELSVPVVQQLAQLAPFGRDNPSVRLRVPGVRVAQRPQLLGSSGKHLAFVIISQRGTLMRCVGFGLGGWVERLRVGMTVDVFGTPKLNTWNQRPTVELEVADVAG